MPIDPEEEYMDLRDNLKGHISILAEKGVECGYDNKQVADDVLDAIKDELDVSASKVV